MIDAVEQVIDTVEPDARPRLRRCLPMLAQATAEWDGHPAPGPLVIACATPRGYIMLAADGWPDLGTSRLKRSEVALALTTAIEDTESRADVVITALTVLLGKSGVEAQTDDAAIIVEGGHQPLVVALLSHEQATVALMITTVALPVATLH